MRDITEREQRGEKVENLDPNYALAAANPKNSQKS